MASFTLTPVQNAVFCCNVTVDSFRVLLGWGHARIGKSNKGAQGPSRIHITDSNDPLVRCEAWAALGAGCKTFFHVFPYAMEVDDTAGAELLRSTKSISGHLNTSISQSDVDVWLPFVPANQRSGRGLRTLLLDIERAYRAMSAGIGNGTITGSAGLRAINWNESKISDEAFRHMLPPANDLEAWYASPESTCRFSESDRCFRMTCHPATTTQAATPQVPTAGPTTTADAETAPPMPASAPLQTPSAGVPGTEQKNAEQMEVCT